MTAHDWCLVLIINGSIILFGLWKARGTRSSVDWFLAARGLPWWMVGLSLFATAVDSGDYIAVAGASYQNGMSYISSWWLGITVGWFTVAYIVFLPMYRTGMFTNAEYLEYRFGPVTRVISVFIQIQYRTNVMANVAFSLYLTFTTLTGWGDQTWWLVVAIAFGAAVYTASGGLKSVAITDAIQSVVMIAASLVMWWTVWNSVGGWTGVETTFERIDPNLTEAMLHVGARSDPHVPPALVVVGWMITLTAYCVVNHSQAMRLLAARSEWDVKMAAVTAGSVTAVVMWFNVTLGILGRAVFPDLESVDEIFPQLIHRFLGPLQSGAVGLVVAGLLASGISTYDSIGSALAALFTRDIYARFFVKYGDDHHYLQVSRLATFLLIAFSFVYVPFLKVGMVELYLKLTGVAVVPLFTVYMLGILTPVHRSSGSIGLFVGILCGLSRFAGPLFPLVEVPFAVWWTNKWWGYLWSIFFTAATMLISSLVLGWAKEEEIRGLVYMRRVGSKKPHRIAAMKGTWLEASQKEVPKLLEDPFVVPHGMMLAWHKRPVIWMGLLVASLGLLNLVVFW